MRIGYKEQRSQYLHDEDINIQEVKEHEKSRLISFKIQEAQHNAATGKDIALASKHPNPYYDSCLPSKKE